MDDGLVRKEFLKAYILSLIGGGYVRASVVESTSFVGELIHFASEDATAVLPEVVEILIAQGAREVLTKFRKLAAKKLDQVVERVGSQGFRNTLTEIAAGIATAYRRGADMNASRSRR